MHHSLLLSGVLVATSAGLSLAQLPAQKLLVRNVPQGGFTFTSIDPFPGINNAGQFVFVADFDDAGTSRQGIFRLDIDAPGMPITKLLDNAGIYGGFSTDVTFINDSGFVAARALRDDAEIDILRISPVGGVDVVASTAGVYRSFSPVPDIAADGTVTFAAALDTDPAGSFSSGVYTAAPGGSPAIREDVTGPYEAFVFFPRIADDNTVTYIARPDGGGSAALVNETAGGSQTVVAQTGVAIPGGALTGFLPYDTNNLADVAYVATTAAERSIRVYDSSTGLTTTLVSESDGFDFTTLPEIALNDAGLLVFGDTTGAGIFFGSAASGFAPVVEAGDPLFGGIVTDVFTTRALTNDGRLVYLYLLDTGELGYAITVIPEPASLAWLTPAGLLLLRRRHA